MSHRPKQLSKKEKQAKQKQLTASYSRSMIHEKRKKKGKKP